MFTLGVTLASRLFLLLDHVPATDTTGSRFSRHAIPSGRNTVDAVFAQSASVEPRAALLLCHGIGETVDHWRAVQHLLAQLGIASLVFDYSGYGQSSGRIEAAQCEHDAVTAFHHLRRLTPRLPASVLGFSLGSGIAASIQPRIPAQRLILCAAFTSFRHAARRLGVPAFLVPPIWSTQQALARCRVPTLLLHGDRDRLFPSQMARDLHQASASSQLVLLPRLAHDDPYRHPNPAFWRRVADFLTPGPVEQKQNAPGNGGVWPKPQTSTYIPFWPASSPRNRR